MGPSPWTGVDTSTKVSRSVDLCGFRNKQCIRDDEHSSIMGLRNRFKGNLACRRCMEKIGWVHEQCNPLQASAPVWLLHWRGHLPR